MVGKRKNTQKQTSYIKTKVKKTTVNLRTKSGKVLKVKATRTSAASPKKKASPRPSKPGTHRRKKGC
jgi:hypothetical protein